MIMTPLYHWAPAHRYDSIRRDGLRPASDPTVAGGRLQYLCLGPDPRRAWAISGAMDYVSEIEYWDLWQVHLVDGDELYVRPDFSPVVDEVKCRTPIPADRLWWIGRRYDLGVPGLDQTPDGAAVPDIRTSRR